MKTKIYLIITAILQIILSIQTILTSNVIVEGIIKSFKAYPQNMQVYLSKAIELYENHGQFIINSISICCILLALIILIIAVLNKINKRKTLLILCATFSFLLAQNSLLVLLSIITIIVIAQIKEDKKTKEKKQIPKLERIDTTKKDIIKAIILLLVYFSQEIWAGFLGNNTTINIIIVIVYYILLFVLAISFFIKPLKRDIKELFKNLGTYIKYIIPRFLLMYLIYFIVAIICTYLTKTTTTVNQEAIKEIPIAITAVLAIIWAPIVEETVFRGGIRRLIKNNALFIIVSALIFGLLHTTAEASVYKMILLSFPYAIMGGFFAYIYTKTNNITCNILCHTTHNTIAVLLMLLAL
jgi:membrane protease YdiL (CAAX protease family)